MLATEYARSFNLEAQKQGESDSDFKCRVAGELRNRGRIIESHEALNDGLYDQNKSTMTGIVGALAFAMAGRRFNGDPIHPTNGKRQVDDDFAAGVLTQNPKPSMSPETALLMVSLFGGR